MTFEERLRTDLHGVPVPTLVPRNGLADTALRSARIRNRMQAVTVASASVVVVAATMPAVWSVLPGGGTTPAGLACAVAAPLPARPASGAWEYFDPLRYEIDESGVEGFQLASYSTSTYFQVLELTNPAQDRIVTITLYATNGVPHYRTVEALPHAIDPAAGDPAAPVGGAPAYWLPEQSFTGLPNGEGLAWQWTPGAWVVVHAAALDPDGPTVEAEGDPEELRAIAADAAEALSFGGGEPVTAPFAMTAPDCTRVTSTSLMVSTRGDGTPFARFGLGFSTEGQTEATNPLLLPDESTPVITVTADSGATPEDKPGSATSDVDGHPAYVDGNFVVVYGVDGFAFEISSGTPGLDPAAVFRTIHVLPGASGDRSTWEPV